MKSRKLNSMMRAAMYFSNTDLRILQVATPRIGSNEALLEIEASGICGTDVMEWYRRDKVPLILGHEVAGTILKLGSKVRKFKVGDRVVATHHVPCEKCDYCRNGHETVCNTLRSTHFDPGGFCEFVRIPSLNLEKGTLRIANSVSFEEATFVEPLGCVVRGQRLSGMKKGQRVLIIGSGLAGLLHVKLAKFLKAKTIIATDIDEYRLRMASKFGATAAVDGRGDIFAKTKEINKGNLADLVILCAGSQSAIEQGLKSVARGGTVLVFTAAKKDSFLPVSTNHIFWRNEVTLLSSYAASPKDLKEALRLIGEKKIIVKDMITHRFPLEEIQKGFDLVVMPQKSLKVIIEPQK